MESAPTPRKISRIDLRFRHSAQELAPRRKPLERREPEEAQKEEGSDESLLIREQKGREVMGRGHRQFHRRQAAEPSNVLTMVVEVIATIDVNGNVIAQETQTPALPSVPAMPTVPLPSVPAVPPFPSDLTVPAYPFPSGVPTAQGSQVAISSPSPTSAGNTVLSSLVPSLGFNSTISSTIVTPTSNFLSVSNSTSFTSTHSSSSHSLSSSLRSSSGSTSSSSSYFSTTSSAAESSSTPLDIIPGAPVGTAAPPAPTTTAAGGASDSTNEKALDTPQVVGSVIGSLAGAALLLALLLFLIKRHKQNQRRGALELSGNDTADTQPLPASGQQMTTRSSFVPAGAAAFFSRFSGASQSTTASTATGERGFQRISGRKLPSAFSEGMTSEQFARGEGALSGSSFYKDEHGIYGGPGLIPKELGKETGEPSHSGTMGTKERIMPSPARTPIIHHPEDAPFGTNRNGGSEFSPPHTPVSGLPPRGTLGRSHPSHDGSRGSKFTEDV